MSAQIFIDADNVKPEIGFKAIEKFSLEHSIEQVEIIGNETTLSSKYIEAGDLYQIKNCFYGKNSADTWLCTEIAKTIFEKPEVDVIIIISSDRDFLAAIKLATDQKRKVIMVSDGNGHKNLKALLYDLRINPDLIELVDFKTELGFNNHNVEKKTIQHKPPPVIQPKTNAERIRLICRKISPNMKNFIVNNRAKLKVISINHAGKFWEVPFYEGINLSTFTNILVALRVIPNGKFFDKVVEENLLKIEDNKIFLNADEKLAPEKNPFDDVINYFVSHTFETKNIFVKCNDKLYEVPFIDGISFNMFSRLLKGYAISDDKDKIKEIIAESFLVLRDDRVYFSNDEEISSELKLYLQKIPPYALEFIRQNEDKLKFVSIAHNNSISKVPFVEGIHLSIFVSMLRQLKIIGKNSDSRKILTANGFTIENDLVYKINSDKMCSSVSCDTN